MGNLFDVEGGVFTSITKLFDVLFLGLLWFIFSIPLVTIGASSTAMYYTVAKVIRRERGYVFREFWNSFKSNFLTATIYTVIIILLSYIFYVNFYFAKNYAGQYGVILSFIYMSLIYVATACLVYLFPVLSRFQMKRFETVKFSLFIAMRHLPITIVLQVLFIGTSVIMYMIPPTMIVCPVIATLIMSLLIERVFKKYVPQSEDQFDEHNKWYQEF